MSSLLKWQWQQPDGPAPVSFNFYRKDGAGTYSLEKSGITGLFYYDKNVIVGHTYTGYTTAVYSGGGESPPSNSASITVHDDETICRVPQGGTRAFRPDGLLAPTNALKGLETWQIYYNGNIIASSGDHQGWLVWYYEDRIFVSCPFSATVDHFYEVRFDDGL